MFELFGGAHDVQTPHRTDHRIGKECGQHGRIPIVGAHEKSAVALQVGAEAADEFHESLILRDEIAHRREAGPHLDLIGVAFGALGRRRVCGGRAGSGVALGRRLHTELPGD